MIPNQGAKISHAVGGGRGVGGVDFKVFYLPQSWCLPKLAGGNFKRKMEEEPLESTEGQ